MVTSDGESPVTVTVPFTSVRSRWVTACAGHLFSKWAVRSSIGMHAARSVTARAEETNRDRMRPLQEVFTIIISESFVYGLFADHPVAYSGVPRGRPHDGRAADSAGLVGQLHARLGGWGGAGDCDCLGCGACPAVRRPPHSGRLPRPVARQADAGLAAFNAARRGLRLGTVGRPQTAAGHSRLGTGRN